MFVFYVILNLKVGDDMKKIFITLLVIIFVFLTLFASVFGIRSFYIAQTKKYNMQQINVIEKLKTDKFLIYCESLIVRI